MRRTYHVHYKMNPLDETKGIDVIASSIDDAYDRAKFEKIYFLEGEYPRRVWVVSVTYANGNHRTFKTSEGSSH